MSRIWKVCTLVFVGLLIAARMARSALAFIRGNTRILDNLEDESQFMIAGIIQAATILPLVLFRVCLDLLSLVSLVRANIHLKVRDNEDSNAALRYMIANLVAELFLSGLTIFFAILEAIGYQGIYVSFLDWALISFALQNWFSQQEMNRRIFRKDAFEDETSADSYVIEYP